MKRHETWRTIDRWRRRILLLSGILTALSAVAFAQTGLGGWPIEIYGMVQVEPGPNVLTLAVRDEEIRFVVHDIRSAGRNFPITRFLADVKHRNPSLYIKGSEPVVELLLKERPGKRALKLQGIFYPDARQFLVHSIKPFTAATPQREF